MKEQNKFTIEIKDSEERRQVAAILFDNGYTVRKQVTKKPNSNTRATVLEYWKEN